MTLPLAKAKILTYVGRLRSGIFSNCKPLTTTDGIYELVIDYGPGYRIYYAKIEKARLLLLTGGLKKKQQRDIDKANKYYQEYLEREENEKKRKS